MAAYPNHKFIELRFNMCEIDVLRALLAKQPVETMLGQRMASYMEPGKSWFDDQYFPFNHSQLQWLHDTITPMQLSSCSTGQRGQEELRGAMATKTNILTKVTKGMASLEKNTDKELPQPHSVLITASEAAMIRDLRCVRVDTNGLYSSMMVAVNCWHPYPIFPTWLHFEPSQIEEICADIKYSIPEEILRMKLRAQTQA